MLTRRAAITGTIACVALPAGQASAATCARCEGAEWVCEGHDDRPWSGISHSARACDCGAGAPCPTCNPLADDV